jgi:FeS assembly protein IscX
VGSAFYEPADKVIADFGNASDTTPMTFIAFYLLDGDQELITLLDPKQGVPMPREIHWTDAEEIGIQLQEKFPDLDPLTVRFTDLHRYVTELEGFADDPAKSNEGKLEAIQMAWHEEYKDAKG